MKTIEEIYEDMRAAYAEKTGLAVGDGGDMQEIADSLGLGVSSVSRTIKRGRVRLRRALDYGGRALAESLRG